jgi:ribosome biogenesis GTPase
MRELGLWDAASGMDSAFDDIEELATQCRFGDCQHQLEPGCAIRSAIEQATLDPARFANYGKLQRELPHEQRRHDPKAMAAYRDQTRRTFAAQALAAGEAKT